MVQYGFDADAFQAGRTAGRIGIPAIAGAITAALTTYLIDQTMSHFGMQLFYGEAPYVGARALIDAAAVYPVFAWARNATEEAMRRREERMYHADLRRRHARDLEAIETVRNRNIINREARLRGAAQLPRLPPRYPPQMDL